MDSSSRDLPLFVNILSPYRIFLLLLLHWPLSDRILSRVSSHFSSTTSVDHHHSLLQQAPLHSARSGRIWRNNVTHTIFDLPINIDWSTVPSCVVSMLLWCLLRSSPHAPLDRNAQRSLHRCLRDRDYGMLHNTVIAFSLRTLDYCRWTGLTCIFSNLERTVLKRWLNWDWSATESL